MTETTELYPDEYIIKTCSSIIKLNNILLCNNNVPLENVEKMKPLYCEIDEILVKMNRLNISENENELVDLYSKWIDCQYKLQELWNFPRNPDYFLDFDIPHCSCPYFDNLERRGSGSRIISQGCIYHGKEKKISSSPDRD